MASRWAAILTASIALTVATGARAASTVPDKTEAFVAYCAGHFAECKNTVVGLDLGVLAVKVLGKKATKECAIPKGVGNDNATKQILAWLGTHKNVHAMKTADGVQAAVKDIWHCKTQIGDGSVPGGPPAKAGAFVDFCRTNYVKCADKMVTVVVMVMLPDQHKHCSPPRGMKTKEITTAVLGWLGQHKETYGMKTEDAIMAAFDKLWPCRH